MPLYKFLLSSLEKILIPSRKKFIVVGPAFMAILLLLLLAYQFTPQQGLSGKYYDNDSWRNAPLVTRIDKKINFQKSDIEPKVEYKESYSVEWEGYLFVPRNSKYFLSITSDDGSLVYLDDSLILDNRGIHPARKEEAKIFLSQGNHKIKILYFDAGGRGLVKFDWEETESSSRIVPKFYMYPKPVSMGLYLFDVSLPYIKNLLWILLWLSGIFFLLIILKKIFKRLDLVSHLSLCLFLILFLNYSLEILSKRSRAVTGCDPYAYLQGAVNMAKNGLFHTEIKEPLVPLIHQSYQKKPSLDRTKFLLSPHGHYVYDFNKGLIYNVFPPGMSFFLLPFVKIGGPSLSFYVLPVLNLAFVILFFYLASKFVHIFFGLCLSSFAFFNIPVFENTVLIMSDLPSMLLLALSLFFIYLNFKTSRRFWFLAAGACSGFSLMVRYTNLLGFIPVLSLFLARFLKEQKWKSIFKDFLYFALPVFAFGIFPFAAYTFHLFGKWLRLVYEPLTQSQMHLANLLNGVSYYSNSLYRTFGPLGIALAAFGLGNCLVHRRKRWPGLVCLLTFSSFFLFYSLNSLQAERYLIPAYPFLALFYSFGVRAAAEIFKKVKLIQFIFVAILTVYPLAYSLPKYSTGSLHEETISLSLKEKAGSQAAVFCDEMSGPIRLYAGLLTLRLFWTDEPTLRETLDILVHKNFNVYFFLDSESAKSYFLYLTSQNFIDQRNFRLISRLHGIPLYHYVQNKKE